MNYWKECVKEALEDAKLKASDEQIDIIALWVDGAAENRSMVQGFDLIDTAVNHEAEELKKELELERARYNRVIKGIAKGVALRGNVDPHDVYISDSGHVTYRY